MQIIYNTTTGRINYIIERALLEPSLDNNEALLEVNDIPNINSYDYEVQSGRVIQTSFAAARQEINDECTKRIRELYNNSKTAEEEIFYRLNNLDEKWRDFEKQRLIKACRRLKENLTLESSKTFNPKDNVHWPSEIKTENHFGWFSTKSSMDLNTDIKTSYESKTLGEWSTTESLPGSGYFRLFFLLDSQSEQPTKIDNGYSNIIKKFDIRDFTYNSVNYKIYELPQKHAVNSRFSVSKFILS